MKLLFLFSIGLLHSITLFAQSYEIEYSHTINFDAGSTNSVYVLHTNPSTSTYFQTTYKLDLNADGEVKQVNADIIPFVKKDYKEKLLYYNQPIANRIFFITDKLPLQSWKLENGTKKITSFTCNKATTTFRGRNYTAWYTTDIPIVGGPWKFDGLPGLILAVESSDGTLAIEATKISSTSTNPPVFDYDPGELISWEEYCKQYRDFVSRLQKSMQANSDHEVELSMNISLVEDIGL